MPGTVAKPLHPFSAGREEACSVVRSSSMERMRTDDACQHAWTELFGHLAVLMVPRHSPMTTEAR